MSREDMVAKATEAIYAELSRQNENEEIGGHGYWDPEWGVIDGEPNLGALAAAAVDAVLEHLSPPF